MNLTMDLSACLICRGKNGTNGCHLAALTVDIAFARNFVVTYLPPPSHSEVDLGVSERRGLNPVVDL